MYIQCTAIYLLGENRIADQGIHRGSFNIDIDSEVIGGNNLYSVESRCHTHAYIDT